MQYQVRCLIWKIEGDSADQAKKKVCELLSQSPESFISVAPFAGRRPLWKQFLWGPK